MDVYLTDGAASLTVELDVAGVDPAGGRGLPRTCWSCAASGAAPASGRRVYQHAEIAWGPFERRLRLGVAVDAAAAQRRLRERPPADRAAARARRRRCAGSRSRVRGDR